MSAARSLPWLLLVLAVALALAGCGAEPVSTTGVSSQAIVGGDVDTIHDAVVTVHLVSPTKGGASCTGTIVSVRPEERIGYVLTAAHCVAGFVPSQIVEGGDNAHPKVLYRPLSYVHDDRWNPPQYDLAVICAVGMDAETPVIPMVGPSDGLAVGDDVLALGFGATLGRGLSRADTVRRSLSMTVVAETPEALTLSGFGDTCEGDSGGPVLAGDGTNERVVGVNSTGDASCFLTSDATRLSSGLENVVQPFIDAPVPESCLRCRVTRYSGRGECVDEAARCEADADCVAVRACLTACNTDACKEACVDAAGPGVNLYFARQHCWCDPCAALCAEEPVCVKLNGLEERRAHPAEGADGGSPEGDSSGRARNDSGCAVTRTSHGEPRRGGAFLLLGLVALVRLRRETRRNRRPAP